MFTYFKMTFKKLLCGVNFVVVAVPKEAPGRGFKIEIFAKVS